MHNPETIKALYTIQTRLCVCGGFNDRERIRIREICQQVLDDNYCRIPTNPATYEQLGVRL